jgi:hypothetical protein
MRSYLIVYDRSRGMILEQREYGPGERASALAERFRIEARERQNPSIEVVVLSAGSVEALHRTHSRYFSTPGQLAEAGLRQGAEE